MHCTEMCERESLNDDHHRYLAFGVFGALHCRRRINRKNPKKTVCIHIFHLPIKMHKSPFAKRKDWATKNHRLSKNRRIQRKHKKWKRLMGKIHFVLRKRLKLRRWDANDGASIVWHLVCSFDYYYIIALTLYVTCQIWIVRTKINGE